MSTNKFFLHMCLVFWPNYDFANSFSIDYGYNLCTPFTVFVNFAVLRYVLK